MRRGDQEKARVASNTYLWNLKHSKDVWKAEAGAE